MKKITLLEDATLYLKSNNQCKIEFGDNIILFENDFELEELKKESPYFFTLKDVTHENKKCVLNYEIDEGYESFFKAKNYSEVIRLSILDSVLELDPIRKFNEKVLLHPRNIYFKDFKTIKFLYRSNQFLPSVKNLSEIDQYKLLILSMLSKYSYEKFKIKKIELLEKENNNFLNLIQNAKTVTELRKLIREKLLIDETSFFRKLEESNKKNKINKVKSKLIVGGIFSAIIVIAIIVNAVQVKNYKILANAQIKSANNSQKAYECLALGDSDTGIKKLKETNPSKNELADAYFISAKYDDAINTNQEYAKKVVLKLYADKEEKKILGFKTKNKYIAVEKDILSFNRNALLLDKEIVTDKEQLLRMATSFIANNDIANATAINEKLNNAQLKDNIAIAEKGITDKAAADKAKAAKK